MPLTISLATTPEQIDAVFKVRHMVLAEQDQTHPPSVDERLFDRFDTYPTTANLIVTMQGQETVGAMRLTLDSSLGIPSDADYDFRAHLPPGACILDCSLYCALREFRSPTIASGLMHMAGYFAYARKATHVVALMSPKVARMLKWAGFEAVGPQFAAPITEQPVVPLVLQVSRLNDSFMSFAKKNAMLDFVQEYRRLFFHPGEHIIRAGEDGHCAYVLIHGEAEALYAGKDREPFMISEGEMFGEIALLTDEPRSADVIAASDVQVMELDKEVFLKYLNDRPDKALELLRSMGMRMRNVIARMNGNYV